MTAEQFGRGLKALMDNEDVSAEMLSEWTGICASAIRSYRRGATFPQFDKLTKIEEVFRMKAEDIAKVQPKRKPEPVYRSIHTDEQLARWFSTGIRVLIQRNRLSIRETATLIGVKPDTFATWIRDERTPKLVNALQIAEVFKTTVEDIIIIGREGEDGGAM